MTSGTPTLNHLFDELLRERLAHVHTSLIASVISYDPVTQTCSCVPVTMHRQPLQEGRSTPLPFPVLDQVPVAHPRWGNWFIHAPLVAGDFVQLVFGESSIDRWREVGGTNVDTVFDHRFDLSDAVACPHNVYPIAAALAGLSAASFSFGKAGGAQVFLRDDGAIGLGAEFPVDAAARASAVLTRLQALLPVLQALNIDFPAIATALGSLGAPGLGVATSSALAALVGSGWPAPVASTKVLLNE